MNADEIARAMAAHEKLGADLRELTDMPPAVIRPDGSVDRAILAEWLHVHGMTSDDAWDSTLDDFDRWAPIWAAKEKRERSERRQDLAEVLNNGARQIGPGLDALCSEHPEALGQAGPQAVMRAMLSDPHMLWSANALVPEVEDTLATGKASARSVGRWLAVLASVGLVERVGKGTGQRWKLSAHKMPQDAARCRSDKA